ncbi:MAG: DUF4339 domain-containing protein [Rhodospirillales bacterium]|nr:DUF4339 domain-containing protein [Acetobacter sp.]
MTPTNQDPVIAAQILVLKDEQQRGPFSVDEINGQLAAGTFELSDLAWHEGLTEWQPLGSIAGVVTGHTHNLRPPPPPVRATGWSPPPTSNLSAPSSKALLVGGYVCAAVSLLFLPPVLGLAGIICGAVIIKHQRTNQGIALLVTSFVCAVIGMIIGAAS